MQSLFRAYVSVLLPDAKHRSEFRLQPCRKEMYRITVFAEENSLEQVRGIWIWLPKSSEGRFLKTRLERLWTNEFVQERSNRVLEKCVALFGNPNLQKLLSGSTSDTSSAQTSYTFLCDNAGRELWQCFACRGRRICTKRREKKRTA